MTEEITFQEVLDRANKIIERYEKIEGKPWNAEGGVIELTKQVGELSKWIMAKEGYYFPDRAKMHPGYDVSDQKIADELADIFRAVIRIAKYYKLDLLQADTQACKEDNDVLVAKGV